MEPWDSLVTSALNLTLGGGAFYIGASLTLYLVKRWNELEPKPKQPQVNIPLVLKEQEAMPLELKRQEVMEAAAPEVRPTPPLVTPPVSPQPEPELSPLKEPSLPPVLESVAESEPENAAAELPDEPPAQTEALTEPESNETDEKPEPGNV